MVEHLQLCVHSEEKEYKEIHHHRSDGGGRGGVAIFIIEKRTNETFLVVFSQLFFLFISGQRMKMKSAQQSLARRYFVHVYSITTGLLLLYVYIGAAGK